MKLGIITDIHSNVIALKTVIKEFKKMDIDKIICCGDMIGIGPQPEETIQELMKLKENLIAIRGNHEQYLINGLPKKVHDDKRKMSLEEIQNHEWTHNQLSTSSIQFIKSLPLYENIVIDNVKIYITHYPTNSNGEYKKHLKYPSFTEVKELFSDIRSDIFLYGHTHASCKIFEEKTWYINPGSVRLSSNKQFCKLWDTYN